MISNLYLKKNRVVEDIFLVAMLEAANQVGTIQYTNNFEKMVLAYEIID